MWFWLHLSSLCNPCPREVCTQEYTKEFFRCPHFTCRKLQWFLYPLLKFFSFWLVLGSCFQNHRTLYSPWTSRYDSQWAGTFWRKAFLFSSGVLPELFQLIGPPYILVLNSLDSSTQRTLWEKYLALLLQSPDHSCSRFWTRGNSIFLPVHSWIYSNLCF